LKEIIPEQQTKFIFTGSKFRTFKFPTSL